jgi:TldD protein
MRNGQVESVSTGYDAGIGCRVLVNGGWGFASTPSTKKEDHLKMVERAVQIAKASARSKFRDVELAPVEIVTDKKETRVLKDPFQMPVDRLAELLKECHEAMVQVPEVKVTGGSLFMSREEKTFASSEGAWIEQTISITGGGVDCMARGNNDVQRRSFNMNKTAGFEALEAMNLVQRSTDMAQEAKILLTADSCPRGLIR